MIKVMIVDDEPYIRQGLGILINWGQYGYEIRGEASNGKEAIEIMEKIDIDIVITDIKMPQMDGIELISYTRENISKDIRFIILSGFYEFEYAKNAIKYNVGEYILKPVDREELIRVLEEYREQFYHNVEQQKKQELSDKIVLDNYLNHLIAGINDQEGYQYVKNHLTDYRDIRYINLEYDQSDDSYQKLTSDEKHKAQNSLYNALKEYLGDNWIHAHMDILSNEDNHAVGFIYSEQLANISESSEKDYIYLLHQSLNSKLSFRIVIYVGQKVKDIGLVSDSYKSAKIVRSFHQFSDGNEIAYFDEIDIRINKDKYLVDKDNIDYLIRAIEENDEKVIWKQTEAVYEHLKDWLVEPEIIKINLDYLLFNLINLVKELDEDYDQEEVYKMVSQCGYNQIAVHGSIKRFREFALEFAGYLSQLRQHSFGGILKVVEREVIENYMDNLSLKSLSEKYFVNSAYLGQIFKKQYGVSFKDYLNAYRIERAAELLIRTDYKIYLVASTVGFNNTDYFINKFVQLKGITPLQYRKQFLEKC